MILTQLESLELPWPKRPVLKRKFKAAKIKARRMTKASIRKARSRTVAAYRRQYFLTSAFKDFRTALSLNEDIFIASTMLMLGIGFCFATIVSQMFLTFLETATEIAEITGFSMAALLLGVSVISAVLFCWLAAFVLNMMSITLMEGLNRKNNKSIRSTARKGLRYASRVTGAWFSVGTLILGPLAIASIALLASVYFKFVTISEMTTFLPYVAVAAIAWLVVSLLQFSLVPYVALFEPTITLRQAFTRNNELVRRRGRLFIMAGYGALAAGIAVAYGFAALMQRFIRIDNLLTFIFGILAVTVIANGIMVMLYRKRKLARVY